MRVKYTKLKKFYRKNQLATNLAIAVVFTIGISGGIAGFIYSAPSKVDSAIHNPNHTTAPKKTPVADEKSPSVISEVESTKQSAQPSYSPDSIMGERERMKDPAYRAAHLAPMAVRSVTYYGSNVTTCDIWNTKMLRMQYVVIMTNHALGGTIKYQLEERQNGTINVLFAGTGSVEDLAGFYETPNLFAYGASGENADSAIRVHVTSPNDISSPWYPAGACRHP